MGNALTASNPSEILPLDHYIKDLIFDMTPIESLGSTRFMKVARAMNSNGCQVFKVFIAPDDSVKFEPYTEEYARLKKVLKSMPNCSPFHRAVVKLRCVAILCRPFQKHTLFDRLNSRPVTTRLERHWFIYQLLRAICQAHENNVFHGDLKSQNVLLSSYLWLQIADFAFFKPTFLPEDNPSVFTYFFDSSRRQTCYIAPERILSSVAHSSIPVEQPIFTGLEGSMDIFSAGCIIYELLHDGHPPFTYGALVTFRNMSAVEANAFINKLVCGSGEMANMLASMLSQNPAHRRTAPELLSDYCSLFPEMTLFFSFLYNYLNAFRPKDVSASSSMDDFDGKTHSMEADDVITKLLHDEEALLGRISPGSFSSTEDPAVFFISLVTSNLRSLRCSSSRMAAMRLLVHFSNSSSSTIAMQRALPYLVSQISESDAQVSSFAIEAIARLICHRIPDSLEDSVIFIDFLFPKFEWLMGEKSESSLAHLALAKHLSRFAEAATRFTEVRKELRSKRPEEDKDSEGGSQSASEEETRAEKAALFKQVTDLFTSLISREDECRLTICRPASLRRLYTFFSAHSQADVLLRHCVTLLNVKTDWHVRGVFFDALPIIVRKSTLDVSALIIQGLHDSEEWVVARALCSCRLLAFSGVLQQSSLFAIIKDIVPFLAHPNEWIRSACVDVMVCLDSLWSLADVHCRLLPAVSPHLVRPLIRLNSKIVVLECLQHPLSRDLWNKLMTLDKDQTNRLVSMMMQESLLRSDGRGVADSELVQMLGKQLSGHEVRSRLLPFNNLLLKMADFRKAIAMESEKKKKRHSPGRISLSQLKKEQLKEQIFTPRTQSSSSELMHFSNGAPSLRASSYEAAALAAKRRELASRQPAGLPSSPRPEDGMERLAGTLITHLHEHKDAVTQMANSPGGGQLASVSSDGCLKLWKTTQLAGNSYGAVRSLHSHQIEPSGVGLTGVEWSSEKNVVFSSSDGQLSLADVSSGVRCVSSARVNEGDGSLEQISASGAVVYARSKHGALFCFDTRMGRDGNGGLHRAWRRQSDNRSAKITSFCVDRHSERWLLTSGTSMKLALWDLRLLVEVMCWEKPSPVGRPDRVWACEHSSPSDPQVVVANSLCGELSLFHLATGSRSSILWPSSKRNAFDYSTGSPIAFQDLNKTMTSVVTGSSGWVVCGDSRGEIRKWCISQPSRSAYLSGITKDSDKRGFRMKYSSKEMQHEGNRIVVTYEKTQHEASTLPESVLEVSSCHRTAVTSLAMLHSGLLVSADSAGILKVWS